MHPGHTSQTEIGVSHELRRKIGLAGPSGFVDKRMAKKHQEVVGFVRQITRELEGHLRKDKMVFLDCGCGKSYLSFVSNDVLTRNGQETHFIGVDVSAQAIEKYEETRKALGYDNMEFHQCQTITFEPKTSVDVVLSLHACDTATDEAIAKGIKLGAAYIMVVPCCQKQIRSRTKSGHPLQHMTRFGIFRYRFADLLTDAMRALILEGAGYEVTLTEIVPPTCTPKNLLICGRKTKRAGGRGMFDYSELRRLFNIRIKLEDMLPEIFDKIVL